MRGSVLMITVLYILTAAPGAAVARLLSDASRRRSDGFRPRG